MDVGARNESGHDVGGNRGDTGDGDERCRRAEMRAPTRHDGTGSVSAQFAVQVQTSPASVETGLAPAAFFSFAWMKDRISST